MREPSRGRGTPRVSTLNVNPHNVRRLERRVAVVTGGAQGLGAAIALRLASEGAKLAIVDISDPESVLAKIADLGSQGRAFAADVTRKTDVERVFGEIASCFETLDILVNNVGGGGSPARLLVDLEEDHWDGSLASNLKSSFLCTQAFARLAIAGKRAGTVINMSSLSGKVGTPLLGMYAVGKAGVIRLTDVFARELARYGIRVNCICPSVVSSPLSDTIFRRHPEIFAQAFDLPDSPDVRAALERKVPLGRLAAPEDVAAIAAFLASDEASYITGQALNCSGGLITH
jgi:NAD(P)-dependent dehydrogenase (short-subunit alcohol dehydrogenase family)